MTPLPRDRRGSGSLRPAASRFSPSSTTWHILPSSCRWWSAPAGRARPCCVRRWWPAATGTRCSVVTSGREYATEDGLQKLICQALGVSDIDDLLERSSQLHATGMQIYLVVDDAHCLQQDALQMLADISQSGRAAPRVFLFAEDSIAEKLESVSMPAERA